MKDILDKKVKKVVLSQRLVNSPCCFVICYLPVWLDRQHGEGLGINDHEPEMDVAADDSDMLPLEGETEGASRTEEVDYKANHIK